VTMAVIESVKIGVKGELEATSEKQDRWAGFSPKPF
jgi:hypothetical protein